MLRSVRARSVGSAEPKTVVPLGFESRELVLAGPLGRLLLSGEATGDERPAAELVRCVGVCILEGEMDLLAAAMSFSDANQDAPALLGVVAGSWSSAFAARVPERCIVTVCTHHDAAGNRYAQRIAQSFVGRDVWLRRHRPGAPEAR
jgi:hypothetical protein